MRIEDVDTPRCVPGADWLILEQLAACGLVSDEPVCWQSTRGAHYQAALDRLTFIRAAQSAGFTLENIAALLTVRNVEDTGQCRGAVQSLIAERLVAVEARMGDLKRVRRGLTEALAACRLAVGECPVVARLAGQKDAAST